MFLQCFKDNYFDGLVFTTWDEFAGLQRCGKSCRLRWINYLRPDLKRGTFSQQEENLIIELHAVLGNRYFLLINVIIELKYVVIN